MAIVITATTKLLFRAKTINVRLRPTNAITKNLIFPDRFIEHNKPEEQYKEMGMDSESIAKKIVNFFDEKIINLKNFTKTYKS